MRTKEYNAYMEKRNLIMKKLNELNVDETIFNYLEEQNMKIKDHNVSVLVKMIKKVIFDFNMYGKETTLRIIDDNSDYLFNGFTNKDNIKQLENEVNTFLKKNKINQDVNDFVMDAAESINQGFYTQQKKYVYVAG